MKEINASEFKAKCLAILDEVATTGEAVSILKRGRPVAQVIPQVSRIGRYSQESLMGTVTITGDIVAPIVAPNEWESEGSDQR